MKSEKEIKKRLRDAELLRRKDATCGLKNYWSVEINTLLWVLKE